VHVTRGNTVFAAVGGMRVSTLSG